MEHSKDSHDRAHCAGDCGHCSGDPKTELITLMKRMIAQNRLQAAALSRGAEGYRREGNDLVSTQLLAAASDLEKAVLRLSTVLAAMGERDG